MMHNLAFILETSRHVEPFGDHVSDTLINHKPLRERQEDALTELGFAVRRISRTEQIAAANWPCVLCRDDVFFNSACLREFLRLSRKAPGSTQCAISKETAFARIFLPFQEDETSDVVRFPLYCLRGPNPAEAVATAIDVREHKLPFYIPPHMRGADQTVLPACVRPLIQIRHAVDVLFANVACVHARFAEVLDSAARRLLLGLRALSLQPARVLTHMNRIGPGCDIHPTAWLEGAEIGAKVQIGANAVIRMSSIGDGCQIGDGSVVKHSVVGSGSVLFDDLTLGFAVCYPETFLIHGPYHLSVFGRSSAMFATILDDFRLDGKPIRLEIDGRLVQFPFPFIGSFIGHRSRVAGGSIISPGRIIPNDLLIFPPAEGTLSRIASNVPRGVPLFIQDGNLREAARNASGEAARSAEGELR
ncbi:MAG: hypothetical protein LAO23_17405 [Acidobacteriia bacterium]|nr:hypothetical protein [Terriglobia bacterium]